MGDAWDWTKDKADKALDWHPVGGRVEGALKGDWGRATLGPLDTAGDAVGLENPLEALGDYMGYVVSPPNTEKIGQDVNRLARDTDSFRYDYDNAAERSAKTIVAPQLQRTTLDPVAQTNVSTAGPAALTGVAKIDTSGSNQFRNQQMGLIDTLRARMEGKGPSVAGEMLKAATDENIGNQLGLAVASGRGGNTALAMRTAAENIGKLNQQAAGQQALVRAQEVATATGQMGGVIDSGRGTDASLATSQAGFQQTTNIANQDARNTGARFDAGQRNTVGLANTEAQNRRMLTQGQIASDESKTQSGMDLQAGQDNARNDLTAQGLTINERAGLRGDILKGQEGVIGGESTKVQLDEKGKDRGAVVLGAGLNAAAGAGGILSKLSDRRAKKDIRPVSDADLLDFARSIDPEAWSYKDGKGEPGTHFGPMAQALERSRIGASLVKEDSAGDKHIDIAAAVPALMVAYADLFERFENLKKELR